MRVEIEWQSALQPAALAFRELPDAVMQTLPCINASLRVVVWEYGHRQQAVRRCSPHRVTEARPLSGAREEQLAVDTLLQAKAPLALLQDLPSPVPVLLLNGNDWHWDGIGLCPAAALDLEQELDGDPIVCSLTLSLPEGPVAAALLDRLRLEAASGALDYDRLEVAIVQLQRESERLYLELGLAMPGHGSPATGVSSGSGTHQQLEPAGQR